MSSSSRKMLQAAAGSAGGAGFYDHEIDNSVRFNYGDSPKLTRTPPTPTDSKKFTYSVWIKRSKTGTAGGTDGAFMLGAATDNANYAHIHIQSDYFWYIDYNGSNTTSLHTYQKKLFRDTSAWYHVVVAVDTTQATATNRIKVYFNGEQFTDWNTGGNTYPAQNYVTRINNTILQTIGTGAQPAYSTWYYNGYLAEATFIDGQQLPATDFAENKNGAWIPKDVSGLTFGNSGFYLKFANSGALGTDSSGNGNNFTSSGLTSSDQMIDTPTSNYATWNPLDKSNSPTIAEGNLKVTGPATSQNNIRATMSMSTGKWYWELTATTRSLYHPQIGIYGTSSVISGIDVSSQSDGYVLVVGSSYNGIPINNGSTLPSIGSFTNGDIVNVAYDADNGKLYWGKNGTWLNSADPSAGTGAVYSGITGEYSPAMSVKDSDVSEINFGQSGFTYTPPTGFVALSTANLPEPAIGPNIDENSSGTTSDEHFNTVLYTGTGSARSVTGFGFQPDNLAIKTRSVSNHWHNVDAVRGVSSAVAWSGTFAEFTSAVDSFDSDGFSVYDGQASVNGSGTTYVAYGWKGNGSGVTNTDGSITSTVSANTDAGFSIVTYTGNATSGATVGHGLGVAPQVVMAKTRGIANSWHVYTKMTGAPNVLVLNDTAALYTNNAVWWNNTDPSSTVFTIGSGSGTNNSGTMVAYCFAEVEGFSKFGSYTGNGSADGSFIYTGFRPAFVMVKRTDSTGNWVIGDTTREPYNSDAASSTDFSYADLPNAPNLTTILFDYLSNGFKLRTSGGNTNGSSGSYIYMAFAEAPFKYSNAR